MTPRFKILFLCTGNSGRSIFAEYLIRRAKPDLFESVSAGASPKHFPHPLTLKVLQEQYQIDVSTARSKSWEELFGEKFDFVITLCDNAKESCPIWPGQPILAHWGSPDPDAFEGTEAEKEVYFWKIAQQINRRIELFVSLPFEKLDALRLQVATAEIGTRESI